MNIKELFQAMLIAVFWPFVMSTHAQAPRRDDTNWQAYNIGTDGHVFTLHSNPAYFPRHMCVGGSFTMIEGRAANNIARFNTDFWESLGQGVDGYVFAIATSFYPWNGVFVGGLFRNAFNPDGSTVPANNIAFWDNSQRKWFPVGHGVDEPVLTLALGGINGSMQLFAGAALSACFGQRSAARRRQLQPSRQ
jgi:hypothetical protein